MIYILYNEYGIKLFKQFMSIHFTWVDSFLGVAYIDMSFVSNSSSVVTHTLVHAVDEIGWI